MYIKMERESLEAEFPSMKEYMFLTGKVKNV